MLINHTSKPNIYIYIYNPKKKKKSFVLISTLHSKTMGGFT